MEVVLSCEGASKMRVKTLTHEVRTSIVSRLKSIAMAALASATSPNRVQGIETCSAGAGLWQRGGVNAPHSAWHSPSGLVMKLFCLAGLGLKHRGQRSSKERLAREGLVLPSTEFKHLFEEGPTELAYANTPVSGLGQAQQGRMCKEWTRKLLQEQNSDAEVLDPEPGICRNGIRRRGSNQAEYDFLVDGRKVAVKSARMAWRHASRRSCWALQFASIKLAYVERAEPAFDDLYLVILSPGGLHLIKHDLVTGVSTRGKLTKVQGHKIHVNASTRTACWKDALDDILEKLCKGGACSMVHEQPLSELGFKQVTSERASPAQAVVAGLPMSSMSREKRGKRIQEIGLAIDRRLHPGSKFSFIKGNAGKTNAPHDWVRGNQRVELKSCGLNFNGSSNRWRAYFSCIKPDLFDELWLAIYSRAGVFFYVSKSLEHLQLCNTGAVTAHVGHVLVFYGPTGELDPLDAFKVIEAKMLSKGCELVAIVDWEKGASTPAQTRCRPQKSRLGHNVCVDICGFPVGILCPPSMWPSLTR